MTDLAERRLAQLMTLSIREQRRKLSDRIASGELVVREPPPLNDLEASAVDDLVFICRRLPDSEPLISELREIMKKYAAQLHEQSIRTNPVQKQIADKRIAG